MRIYEKKHLTASGLVCTGACTLRYLTLNKTDAATILINDDLTGLVTTIATIQASAIPQTFRYDCIMSTGIYVTLNGSQDVTVIYEKP